MGQGPGKDLFHFGVDVDNDYVYVDTNIPTNDLTQNRTLFRL